jgi:hypothetical protein
MPSVIVMLDVIRWKKLMSVMLKLGKMEIMKEVKMNDELLIINYYLYYVKNV